MCFVYACVFVCMLVCVCVCVCAHVHVCVIHMCNMCAYMEERVFVREVESVSASFVHAHVQHHCT